MTRTFRSAGLTLMALTALALTVFPARDARPQDDKRTDKPSPIEGAWKQVGRRSGDTQEYQKPPEDAEMIKYVTGGRWVWTWVKDGRVLAALGGKYTVDKDSYNEIIEYCLGENQASFVGNTSHFTWKVEGDTWFIVGSAKINDQELKMDEKWERCK
jgi:hypothetical protein